MTIRVVGAIAAIICVLGPALSGCAAGVTESPGASSAQSETPALSPGSPASSVSTSSPSGSPAKLPVLRGNSLKPIPAGTYVTPSPDGFFPGLTLTIPDGWSAVQTDSGEIELRPADRRDDALFLWKDAVAVVTNNQHGNVGDVLDGVDSSADALVKWLTSTSDFTILAKPKSVRVGGGIKGVQLTLTTSRTANFADSGCPDNPRCAALLKDPNHWMSHDDFYAIGGAEVARIFVTTLPYPGDKHTFWIVLDAVNRDDVAGFAAEAQPIIDSLRLPETYVIN